MFCLCLIGLIDTSSQSMSIVGERAGLRRMGQVMLSAKHEQCSRAMLFISQGLTIQEVNTKYLLYCD